MPDIVTDIRREFTPAGDAILFSGSYHARRAV